MIPRLNLESPLLPHKPTWPAEPKVDTPLFVGRPSYRRLVVLADAELIEDVDGDQAWSPTLILTGLLTHDYVECYRYADDGPPAAVERVQTERMGEVVPGWAVLSAVNPASGIYGVRVGEKTWIRDSGIMGTTTQIATEDTRTSVYSELAPEAAAQRRRLDALGAQVAEAVRSDFYLTERPYLGAADWTIAKGVTYLSSQHALPFVSLYLRAQGEFIIFRDPLDDVEHTMNRGLFFWVGTRELLPAAWRWFNACAQFSFAHGDNGLLLLGQSVLMRFARALQMRDQLHIALNTPQNNDIADDALSALDVVLLLLMGAVDAVARVVHRVLQISGSARLSWQHDQWLARVVAAAPQFAPLIGKGTRGAHAMTVLRLLRNSVHGEALRPIAVRDGWKPQRTLVGLPADEARDLLDAINALGGQPAWGVEELIPGQLHADPGILLEQLLPSIIDLVNGLLEATPVEQLPSVVIEDHHTKPPAEAPFDERARTSIRWQLGF
jgi:hypothetical protein